MLFVVASFAFMLRHGQDQKSEEWSVEVIDGDGWWRLQFSFGGKKSAIEMDSSIWREEIEIDNESGLLDSCVCNSSSSAITYDSAIIMHQ